MTIGSEAYATAKTENSLLARRWRGQRTRPRVRARACAIAAAMAWAPRAFGWRSTASRQLGIERDQQIAQMRVIEHPVADRRSVGSSGWNCGTTISAAAPRERASAIVARSTAWVVATPSSMAAALR